MASKSKWKHQERRVLSSSEIEARVQQALREGRTQQALELARNLFKQDRSPAHLELVQKATLERARQLRSQGYARDAGTLLANAAELGGQDFLREVTLEMARCGEVRQAMSLVDRVDDPEIRKRTMVQAADHAIRQGTSGRGLLPEPLREQHDLVLQAFRHMEAGQDEAARTTLQGIGLQSPFLEWKLLIRGFMAYYHKDNGRALENWQRLDPDRLPARLAAPFRAFIDSGFQQAQSPAVQKTLQAAADRVQGSALLPSLRSLQAALADEEQMPGAFRMAENLLPALKQMHPHLAPRLAACFYWAIIDHGLPEDKQRYRRVFGAPADDPDLLRLECLALERCHNLPDAHVAWQAFDRWLQTASAWGSEERRQRVRALLWCHLGENADAFSQPPDFLPSYLRRRQKRSELKPSAEQCYRQSLKLAPDLLEAHEALFKHYRRDKKIAKAIKAGEDLLQRFPQHVATLEALGDLCTASKDFSGSLQYLQRALHINPLERRLRDKVSFVHQSHARDLAMKKQFAEARTAYQAALGIAEPADEYVVRAKWAACELKAGEPARAEELIQQARERGNHPLSVTYFLVIESSRLKLPKAIKDRFSRELAQVLDQPASVLAAVELVEIAAVHRKADVEYHGQKTHEKKVLAYLTKALPLAWTEDQLERTCSALLELPASKVFRQVLQRGKKAFPNNPVFLIHEAEAVLSGGAQSHWRARPLLAKAQELVRALPPGERQTRLLEEVHKLQDLVRDRQMPMGLPPMEFFEELLDFDVDDDEDDADKDDFFR